jgi:hypothetical protein
MFKFFFNIAILPINFLYSKTLKTEKRKLLIIIYALLPAFFIAPLVCSYLQKNDHFYEGLFFFMLSYYYYFLFYFMYLNKTWVSVKNKDNMSFYLYFKNLYNNLNYKLFFSKIKLIVVFTNKHFKKVFGIFGNFFSFKSIAVINYFNSSKSLNYIDKSNYYRKVLNKYI